MDPVGVAAVIPAAEASPSPAWPQRKCPWGTPENTTISCSLADVMSEQLAKELQLKEESAAFPKVVSIIDRPFISGENVDTSSDLMLAQMLQMEFDREYDAQLLREEKKFNGDSKVSISFENYRKVHPFEDSDSSEDEVDWQDTRHDPYKADKPTTTPKKGFIGKGKDITTKHDEVVCGRKNTARMENFGPEFQVGDGIGMDLKLSNHVFNALKRHAYSEERRSARLHEKKEHSTAEKAVDPKTRLLLYKMVNSGMLDTITGCISTGKESVVFHAYGGRYTVLLIIPGSGCLVPRRGRVLCLHALTRKPLCGGGRGAVRENRSAEHRRVGVGERCATLSLPVDRSTAAMAMTTSDDYYLALCARPVQFEKASPVNCVFFDEANKQVFAVRSGGATGVVVKGLEDRNPISFRMEDKGEVKCIKFSLGNKILAVQRTLKNVDFLNFIPDCPQLEYTQECKIKNASILGFCWTGSAEIVFVTDQGIEFYQVLPEKRTLKLLKSQNINVNWFMYCPESSVILLSTTVLGNVLQPFYFKGGAMSKLSKFEIELPTAPKSSKLSLSERDIALTTIYGQLYVLYLRHHSRTSNSTGAEVVLYHLPREGSCKKLHILKLYRTGKFALNVVDNLVVVHHQDTETSIIFDIKLKGEFDGTIILHQLVLPPRSIQPYQIPVAGPASVTNQFPVPCKLYSSSWIVFQPDIIISASEGYLWNLQMKLEPTVNLLPDKGKLMDFLLQRKDCKMVILSVCSQMLNEPEGGSLSVIATIFDKLNHEYKKYLEAEQAYTTALETGQSRGNPPPKRPVRTQAVIDQSDMYTHVLSIFTEKKEAPHKFTIAVVMEYIRSLNQFQIAVQHFLYELVIKTLVQHNLFYMLHQFLQYHVLSDSKPLACLLLSLESIYPPAHQLSLDMLKRLCTANDEIVEVLLSKHQVLAALRFLRGIGGHDSISARKFLDAAKQTEDEMLFYTIFRFFEQRNQRIRGNPSFTPGEHCEEHVTFFKQVFGDQALMKPATF